MQAGRACRQAECRQHAGWKAECCHSAQADWLSGYYSADGERPNHECYVGITVYVGISLSVKLYCTCTSLREISERGGAGTNQGPRIMLVAAVLRPARIHGLGCGVSALVQSRLRVLVAEDVRRGAVRLEPVKDIMAAVSPTCDAGDRQITTVWMLEGNVRLHVVVPARG